MRKVGKDSTPQNLVLMRMESILLFLIIATIISIMTMTILLQFKNVLALPSENYIPTGDQFPYLRVSPSHDTSGCFSYNTPQTAWIRGGCITDSLLKTRPLQTNEGNLDVFSPLDHVYNLTIGSHIYPIRYSIPLGKGTV